MGLNSHIESYSYKQDLVQHSNNKFKLGEFKHLTDKIADLETTLKINKTLIETLLSSPDNSRIVQSELIRKYHDENELNQVRLKSLYQQNCELSSKLLLEE
jgi:hypothetical protein